MDEKTIQNFIESEPALKPYAFFLNDLIRQKKHVLSEDAEKVIAEAAWMSQATRSVYNALISAGLTHSKVKLSTGETIELDQAGLRRYRSLASKEDRELVNRAYYSDLNKWRRTFGELMNAKINMDLFNTRVRGFSDCLEMTLEPNNIPAAVFHNLIANANKNLDKFYRYLKIRTRLLGVDKLEFTDLSVPTFRNLGLSYDIEEAKELILESLQPLGETYTSIIKKAFENRWIDVYPTSGKRSNGYTDSGAYAEHPYVLMNYSGGYQDVSTLTHELGHVLHRYLTDRAQPFPTSNYASFVAALTGDKISRIYLETLRKYYGHDISICNVPDYFDINWIFGRLLFINTYRIYVYATSQVATTFLAEKVIAGERGAVQKYLDFLSAGGSDYPHNLLKSAGVDLTSSEPFAKTMEAMDKAMDEIERILVKKGM